MSWLALNKLQYAGLYTDAFYRNCFYVIVLSTYCCAPPST